MLERKVTALMVAGQWFTAGDVSAPDDGWIEFSSSKFTKIRVREDQVQAYKIVEAPFASGMPTEFIDLGDNQ